MADNSSANIDVLLAEARDDVKHADQKASLLLAALGIGFGAIVGGQLSAGWDSASLGVAGQFLFWMGVTAAVASVAGCAWAIWPRYDLSDEPRFGITYWGHVAAYKDLDHLRDALRVAYSAKARTEHQLWKISGLVLTKYRCIRAAIISAAAAAVLLFAAIVLIG